MKKETMVSTHGNSRVLAYIDQLLTEGKLEESDIKKINQFVSKITSRVTKIKKIEDSQFKSYISGLVKKDLLHNINNIQLSEPLAMSLLKNFCVTQFKKIK